MQLGTHYNTVYFTVLLVKISSNIYSVFLPSAQTPTDYMFDLISIAC